MSCKKIPIIAKKKLKEKVKLFHIFSVNQCTPIHNGREILLSLFLKTDRPVFARTRFDFPRGTTLYLGKSSSNKNIDLSIYKTVKTLISILLKLPNESLETLYDFLSYLILETPLSNYFGRKCLNMNYLFNWIIENFSLRLNLETNM